MAGELTSPRVRPTLRRIAMWVMPVLLLIAAWQIWDAIEARRLERALPAVVGPSISFEIRAGGTDEGAGKYYSAAAMLAVSVRGGERIQPVPGGPIADPATAIRDALANGNAPAKEVLDAATTQIEEGRPVFDLLAHASVLPFRGFAPGTEFNYRFSGLLDVNRLAGLETMNLILSAHADRAARLLLDRLQSLRAFEERSFMQTAKAIQVQEIAGDLGVLLGRLNASEELLSDLDRAASQMYSIDALERAIRGEVLWMHQEIRSIWEGRSLRFVTGPLLRPVLRHHAVTRLHVAADALAVAGRPWPDRISAMNGIPDRRSIVPEALPFVAAWREAALVREQTVLLAEGVSAIRCARVVIAIDRYRRAQNRLPNALTDVVPAGDERTIDPFTGKPLVYARTQSGYVVYSVGRNGRDEGGAFSPDLSRGQPASRRPRDVGVRVVFSPTERTP
jgi:hypothetical protein